MMKENEIQKIKVPMFLFTIRPGNYSQKLRQDSLVALYIIEDWLIVIQINQRNPNSSWSDLIVFFFFYKKWIINKMIITWQNC